jgi:hypothetical protein
MSSDPFIHYMRTMDEAATCGARLTGPGQSISTSTSDRLVNCPACLTPDHYQALVARSPLLQRVEGGRAAHIALGRLA